MTLHLPSLPISTEVSSIKTAVQTHLGGSPAVSSIDKIKIILNKKPIPSSKRTLADAFADTPELLSAQDGGNGEVTVNLSVMVMGGAPDPSADAPTTVHLNSSAASVTAAASQPTASTETQVGPESEKAAAEKLAADAGGMEGVLPSSPSAVDEELGKQEFWADLQAFLAQRLKSEDKAEELRRKWEGSWRGSGGS